MSNDDLFRQYVRISDKGIIEWKHGKSIVPEHIRNRAVELAARKREEFLAAWSSLSEQVRYRKVLDSVPLDILCKICRERIPTDVAIKKYQTYYTDI